METRITIDNDVVRQHKLYSRVCPSREKGKRKRGSNLCGKKLNDISECDYKKRYFDENILCLDMDSYEASLTRQQEEPTMDAAIGVSTDNKIGKLMLVELRIDCTSPKNFNPSLLVRKLSHTKSLLLNYDTSVYPGSYFVYNEEFLAMIKTRFNLKRREYKELSKAIAIDVSQFNKILEIKR